MSVSAAQQTFINDYGSYAQIAAQQTGVPWQTILAQWANETGWGTSPAFVTGHNFAGVSPGGSVAYYPSVSAGLAAYIQTLNLPIYASVRTAAAQGPVAAAAALGQSPWAGSHYTTGSNPPGFLLTQIMDETGLDPSAGATAQLASWYSPSNLIPAIVGTVIPGSTFLPSLIDPSIGNATSNVATGAASALGGVASDIAGAVVDMLAKAIEKPAIGALFLILAGGLVAAGVWNAAQPTVGPAVDKAKDTAKKVGEVAAVAAA